MLPFKDSRPRRRPPLVAAALCLLALALWIAGPLGGGLAELLLGLLALAVFGQSVEDVLGHGRFAALCAGAWLLGFVLQLPFGHASSTPLLAGTVLVAAVLCAYLALRPRERILTLLVVPLFAGVLALPAVALIAAWAAAETLLWALGGRR